ncbi:hypothetical protein BJV77DRAFT_963540 [Russula vinacea]|nr:hypothetical protein BJV77DRAFT_963540 [Russula vinacea]
MWSADNRMPEARSKLAALGRHINATTEFIFLINRVIDPVERHLSLSQVYRNHASPLALDINLLASENITAVLPPQVAAVPFCRFYSGTVVVVNILLGISSRTFGFVCIVSAEHKNVIPSYYIIPIIIIRLVVPLFAKLQLSGRIAAGSSKQLSIRVEIECSFRAAGIIQRSRDLTSKYFRPRVFL